MGKSTLAELVRDRKVISTDDYKSIAWSDIPLRIIADTMSLDSFVIEGVQVARALRKGLEVDAVIYLTAPKVKNRKPGQVAMAKGVRTVFDEWNASNETVPVFMEGARIQGQTNGNF